MTLSLRFGTMEEVGEELLRLRLPKRLIKRPASLKKFQLTSSAYVIPWFDLLTWIGQDLEDLKLYDAGNDPRNGTTSFISAGQLSSVLLKYSETLVNLSLSFLKVEGEEIQSFNHGTSKVFPNLKSLILESTDTQLLGPFSIVQCPNLQDLDIRNRGQNH